MKKLLGLILVGVLTSTVAQAQEKNSPFGYWQTENKRSVIKVEKCDKGICGHIAWIIKGGMQYDTKNPQESLRGQPMCGLEILQGFKQSSGDEDYYIGGKIYKADDGDIYNATMKMKSADKMTVRGYVGISLLGKSQTWKRVDVANFPTCKKPN